jgi:hypothetical protein
MREMLTDETGALSSRRLMFLVTGFALCFALVAQGLTTWDFSFDEHLVDAVMVVCICSGGFATLDKFSPVARSASVPGKEAGDA